MAPPLGAERKRLAYPTKAPGAVASGSRVLPVCTMSWVPVLLMLLVYCTGCVPQPVLHQPPSMSSPLGTTVRLTCTLSSNYNIGVYSIYWYQQRLGNSPRFLLRYFSYSDQHWGPNVPHRFSGSKDVARNRGYLIISKLKSEDEAMYFCAVGPQSMEREKMERESREEKDPAASGSQMPQDMYT
ncbi:immunoglobulin iota chain [Marmota marmota marmota]|uniref:immunoglobulin iota chain n=1 Tax=Marmota marmota marmota TaxID=9994 RepID=UPI0020937965|nr:immunoglobulin iota chain [Marmota marmota marmota]